MKRSYRVLALVGLTVACLAVIVVMAAPAEAGGCGGCGGCGPKAPTTQPAEGKIVNARCPIMSRAIDPAKVPASLTRTYKGEKVGFCCGGCPAKWDALSEADKDAKLKAAL